MKSPSEVEILSRELGRITYRIGLGRHYYRAMHDVVTDSWVVINERSVVKKNLEDTPIGSRVIEACESARDTCET